jgi:transcriptional regulator with XRE-family HTH domain
MYTTGLRIKKYRELMGINQGELAALVGKSGKVTISHWETGKSDPSLAEVRKLAEIFQTTVASLVGEAPVLEEPRENYILVKKDDLIELQRKALEVDDARIKDLQDKLEKTGQTETTDED